jgi:hypothetical protein
MEFVVDRAKWLNSAVQFVTQCGVPYHVDGTLLHQPSGKMCCLGFVCQQLGIPEERLDGTDMPAQLVNDYPDIDEKSLIDAAFTRLTGNRDGEQWNNSPLSIQAANINDDSQLSVAQKEQHLIELFVQNGHTLRFEGEFPTEPVRIEVDDRMPWETTDEDIFEDVD